MGAMDDLDPRAQFALLPEATQRLVRTVDGLDDEALDGPSGLPEWTRAHGVAHLALNAEGMARVREARVAGEPTTMYPSDEARASDIDDLATGDRAALRERFMASTTLLVDGVDDFPDEWWGEAFERTPGGRAIRYAAVPGMRLREVEIHHVDLAAGFAPTGWSDAFSAHLISAMVKRRPSDESFRVLATDLAHTWEVGDNPDETTVSGPAGDLGWWLTGRAPAESLTCSTGDLPLVKAW
jgi:maleylpyruvate isomerase